MAFLLPSSSAMNTLLWILNYKNAMGCLKSKKIQGSKATTTDINGFFMRF
jgi:hypothetical protein